MTASVFISYRRKDWALAQLLARDIDQRADATIMIDDRTVDGNSLERALLPHVQKAAVVLLLVTPTTFDEDRIKRPDDRVRRIVAAAIQARRPIIPIYADGARPRYNLPDDIRAVAWADGVTLSPVSYEACLDRLLHLMGLQVGIGRRQRVTQPALAGVGHGASHVAALTLDPDVMVSMARRAHYELPMLSWVNIPAGSLTMHTIVGAFEVPAFAISRYPVTHAQFRAFVDDMGYSDQRWWEGLVFPSDVELPDHTRQTHPMVNVTWYEAMAFCRWLSYKTGLDLTLPTEAQWQWAAHGEARTLYPWGDTFDLSRCNIKESGFGGTTPVDRFAEGVSPFGVADLSGNVWEWTRSEYDSPDKDTELNITSPTLRGGSFEERMKHVRTTSRARYYPHLRRHDLGFRVACRTWVES